MSKQNVEITTRSLDAFNRGDVDAFLALTTADFEWFPAMAATVEGGGHQGRKGIETYFAEVRDTWKELRLVPDEVRDLGEPQNVADDHNRNLANAMARPHCWPTSHGLPPTLWP
jgi:ketosteroid isomerase-like protein